MTSLVEFKLSTGHVWEIMIERGGIDPRLVIPVEEMRGIDDAHIVELVRELLGCVPAAKLWQIESTRQMTERLQNQTSRKKRKKPGFVYIVQAGNHYKIGRTANLRQRLAELARYPPFDLTTVHVIETDNPKLVEGWLHHLYRHKHYRGEWYTLDQTDIDTIRSSNYDNI